MYTQYRQECLGTLEQAQDMTFPLHAIHIWLWYLSRCECLVLCLGMASSFSATLPVFFWIPGKSSALQLVCATAVVLCTAAGLYIRTLAHSCYLQIIEI